MFVSFFSLVNLFYILYFVLFATSIVLFLIFYPNHFQKFSYVLLILFLLSWRILFKANSKRYFYPILILSFCPVGFGLSFLLRNLKSLFTIKLFICILILFLIVFPLFSINKYSYSFCDAVEYLSKKESIDLSMVAVPEKEKNRLLYLCKDLISSTVLSYDQELIKKFSFPKKTYFFSSFFPYRDYLPQTNNYTIFFSTPNESFIECPFFFNIIYKGRTGKSSSSFLHIATLNSDIITPFNNQLFVAAFDNKNKYLSSTPYSESFLKQEIPFYNSDHLYQNEMIFHYGFYRKNDYFESCIVKSSEQEENAELYISSPNSFIMYCPPVIKNDQYVFSCKVRALNKPSVLNVVTFLYDSNKVWHGSIFPVSQLYVDLSQAQYHVSIDPRSLPDDTAYIRLGFQFANSSYIFDDIVISSKTIAR